MRAAVANQHCTMLPLLNQGVDVHSRDSVHSRCCAARLLLCVTAAFVSLLTLCQGTKPCFCQHHREKLSLSCIALLCAQ